MANFTNSTQSKEMFDQTKEHLQTFKEATNELINKLHTSIYFGNTLSEIDFNECLDYLMKTKEAFDQYFEDTEKLIYLRAERTKVEKKEVTGVRVLDLEELMKDLRKEHH